MNPIDLYEQDGDLEKVKIWRREREREKGDMMYAVIYLYGAAAKRNHLHIIQ